VVVLSPAGCSDTGPASPEFLDPEPRPEAASATLPEYIALRSEAEAIAAEALAMALQLNAYVRFFSDVVPASLDERSGPNLLWVEGQHREIQSKLDQARHVGRGAENAYERWKDESTDGIALMQDCPDVAFSLAPIHSEVQLLLLRTAPSEIAGYVDCEEGPCWWEALLTTLAGIGYLGTSAAAIACIVLDPTNLLCVPLVLAAIGAFGALMSQAQSYITQCQSSNLEQLYDYLGPKCADFLDWIGQAPEWMWDEDGAAIAVVSAALNWCSELPGGGS